MRSLPLFVATALLFLPAVVQADIVNLTTQPGGDVVLGSGSKLTDTAILEGGNNPTGTLTFQLFDPSNNSPYTDTVVINGDTPQ